MAVRFIPPSNPVVPYRLDLPEVTSGDQNLPMRQQALAAQIAALRQEGQIPSRVAGFRKGFAAWKEGMDKVAVLNAENAAKEEARKEADREAMGRFYLKALGTTSTREGSGAGTGSAKKGKTLADEWAASWKDVSDSTESAGKTSVSVQPTLGGSGLAVVDKGGSPTSRGRNKATQALFRSWLESDNNAKRAYALGMLGEIGADATEFLKAFAGYKPNEAKFDGNGRGGTTGELLNPKPGTITDLIRPVVDGERQVAPQSVEGYVSSIGAGSGFETQRQYRWVPTPAGEQFLKEWGPFAFLPGGADGGTGSGDGKGGSRPPSLADVRLAWEAYQDHAGRREALPRYQTLGGAVLRGAGGLLGGLLKSIVPSRKGAVAEGDADLTADNPVRVPKLGRDPALDVPQRALGARRDATGLEASLGFHPSEVVAVETGDRPGFKGDPTTPQMVNFIGPDGQKRLFSIGELTPIELNLLPPEIIEALTALGVVLPE